MPAMPYYYLGKGTQFGLLDRQFGGSEDEFMAAYDEALAILDGPDAQPLAEAARKHTDEGSGRLSGLSEDDVEHFRRHWLEDWLSHKHVEAVLRNGFAAAFLRALELLFLIEAV